MSSCFTSTFPIPPRPSTFNFQPGSAIAILRSRVQSLFPPSTFNFRRSTQFLPTYRTPVAALVYPEARGATSIASFTSALFPSCPACPEPRRELLGVATGRVSRPSKAKALFDPAAQSVGSKLPLPAPRRRQLRHISVRRRGLRDPRKQPQFQRCPFVLRISWFVNPGSLPGQPTRSGRAEISSFRTEHGPRNTGHLSRRAARPGPHPSNLQTVSVIGANHALLRAVL